jgi:diadenosine tetraphosphate (Ap4A) HIT family hydrolase
MSNTNAAKCCFCAELSGSRDTDFHRRHGQSHIDRVLWRSKHLVLLPTLGQLTPGHVLLVPTEHVNSLALLPRELYGEVEQTVNGVHRMIMNTFSTPICFEHGSNSSASSGGCGISHAHMHFVPAPAEELIEDRP